MKGLWSYTSFNGESINECLAAAAKSFAVNLQELEYVVINDGKTTKETAEIRYMCLDYPPSYDKRLFTDNMIIVCARPKADCEKYKIKVVECFRRFALEKASEVKNSGKGVRFNHGTDFQYSVILDALKDSKLVTANVEENEKGKKRCFTSCCECSKTIH